MLMSLLLLLLLLWLEAWSASLVLVGPGEGVGWPAEWLEDAMLESGSMSSGLPKVLTWAFAAKLTRLSKVAVLDPRLLRGKPWSSERSMSELLSVVLGSWWVWLTEVGG